MNIQKRYIVIVDGYKVTEYAKENQINKLCEGGKKCKVIENFIDLNKLQRKASIFN
jgi:hypothetical protein